MCKQAKDPRVKNIKVKIGLLSVYILIAIALVLLWSLFTTMIFEKEPWSLELLFSKENVYKTFILLGVGLITVLVWPERKD